MDPILEMSKTFTQPPQPSKKKNMVIWLVISTHLKNIRQKMGIFPKFRGENRQLLNRNHQVDILKQKTHGNLSFPNSFRPVFDEVLCQLLHLRSWMSWMSWRLGSSVRYLEAGDDLYFEGQQPNPLQKQGPFTPIKTKVVYVFFHLSSR